MKFNDYQKQAATSDVGTAAQGCINPGWLYYVLGIAGESGEFAEKVKKLFRDKNGIIDDEFIQHVKKEQGDILWYMARFNSMMGIDFDDVAKENLNKLLGRMERGTIHGDGDNR